MPALSRSRRAAWALLTAAGILAAMEGVARVLPDDVSGHRQVVVPDPSRPEELLANEDVPGWDLAYPGGRVGNTDYSTNRWRMRGEALPGVRPPNAIRVVLTGDSSIFGYGLRWEDSIAAWLERAREEREPDLDYQVAACAAPGHTTVQTLFKLEAHCLPFEPDVVVIGNLNSDATFDSVTDRERFHTGLFSGPARLLGRLATYRTLRNLLIRPRRAAEATTIPQLHEPGAPRGEQRRVPIEQYEENLEKLVALSRRRRRDTRIPASSQSV